MAAGVSEDTYYKLMHFHWLVEYYFVWGTLQANAQDCADGMYLDPYDEVHARAYMSEIKEHVERGLTKTARIAHDCSGLTGFAFFTKPGLQRQNSDRSGQRPGFYICSPGQSWKSYKSEDWCLPPRARPRVPPLPYANSAKSTSAIAMA
eukprot:365763-Chlamydomonas_euryale.AAC.1